ALWKNRAGDRDMALQHAGKAVPHFGGWLADREGARDVGRAILVLAAGIDQEYPFADLRVGLDRHPVMRNGGIGAGGHDRWKRHILQLLRVAPERFEGLRRIDLAEFSARRMDREPVQKADHRGAIPQLRVAGAREFGRVLARLHRRDWVAATF